ncbi:MAG TPA: RNA polymerase sigma factor [Steroidobacteraceae bacterium]
MRDMGSYDDAEACALLEATFRGDEPAFARLYAMTSGRVSAYLCRVLRDREAIEDILTETYVEVWRGSGKFRHGSLVITWIIGIARNLAMNWLKRRTTHDSLDDADDIAAPDEGHDSESHRRIVSAGLSALPHHHREILALALLRELPYEEISALLHIPLNTVKSRVFYAKSALRSQLATMGIARDDVI